MMRHRAVGLAIAGGVFLLDQLSKYLVTVPLDLRNRGLIALSPIFDLRWVENSGISFGLLSADGDLGRWALVAMTSAIAAAVAWWLWKPEGAGDAPAFGLVLGGALGNIVDRARFGYVVDFADLHFGAFRPFMVFNVADAAITLGVVALLVRALFVRDEKKVTDDA